MSKDLLVFAETRNGEIRNVAFEALSVAKIIASGGKVTAMVLAAQTPNNVEALGHYGANKIITVENEKLEPFTTDAYAQAFMQVIQTVNPDAILLGHTAIGKELAPRIAAKLGIGLISDCTSVSFGDELLFTRPIYAGKAFERKRVKEGMIFATVRPNNISVLNPDNSVRVPVEQVDVEIKELRTIIKEIVKKTSNTVDLTEAKIIVSGGRGVKSAEGFAPLRELAEVLGAGVGASRGACDQQYCDYSMQIGQTGKVVTPDLYIACGISGAIQHLAGMSNSKVIVAINTDAQAPIFKVADYGIVGDLFEVVPLLTAEFRKVMVTSQ